MAPLAGRPPFATDEPDAIYETPQPQRRLRQPAPSNPDDRTSAYNMYDNYLGNEHRQSGMGGIGMGFLNGDMDDDDDDDDRRQAAPLPSKHKALAAATADRQTPSPPPQYIASPRPGYAAPIAALNLARPEPAKLQINVNNPFILPSEVSSPSIHPLQAPMTPITPAFARPPKQEISFADDKPILRGDSEGTVLPKRGERGDDFWRRFSVIAHDESENRKSGSSWLRKTQNGSTRLSRWVWITGIILALCAAGGIGLGWYVSHNDTSHDTPTALGGSEGNAASVTAAVDSEPTATAQTSLHVEPTFTVDRRAYKPHSTHVPIRRNSSHRRNRILD